MITAVFELPLFPSFLPETEKYAHVTFFFNGGQEKPFDGEDRLMVPSPRVPTYDLQPEMSADGVAKAVSGNVAYLVMRTSPAYSWHRVYVWTLGSVL